MTLRTFACALLGALAGCHSTASSKPIVLTNGVAVRSRGFGDTLIFQPHIIAIDRIDERAAASVAVAGHALLLGIVPGREIELLEPIDAISSSRKVGGTFSLSMQRFEVDATFAAALEQRREAAERRCEADKRARQQQAQRNAKSAQKRDSTGRVISGPSDASVAGLGLSVDSRSCRTAATAGRADKAVLKRIAPRPAGDRYLVMLVSSSPLKWDFLNERLATLTAVGADAATTIEAIAAGLFVGSEGKWAGTFVAW